MPTLLIQQQVQRGNHEEYDEWWRFILWLFIFVLSTIWFIILLHYAQKNMILDFHLCGRMNTDIQWEFFFPFQKWITQTYKKHTIFIQTQLIRFTNDTKKKRDIKWCKSINLFFCCIWCGWTRANAAIIKSAMDSVPSAIQKWQ